MISMLAHALESALRAEMTPGERLVLVRQPRPAGLVRILRLNTAVGTVVATAGAGFAAYAQFQAEPPMSLPGGLPAWVLGLAAFTGGLAQCWRAHAMHRAMQHTVYFVTDRRAGAIHACRRTRVVTWSREQLRTARLGDGAGSMDAVTFAASDLAARRARRTPLDTLLEGMHGIERADEALAAIRQLAAAERSPRG